MPRAAIGLQAAGDAFDYVCCSGASSSRVLLQDIGDSEVAAVGRPGPIAYRTGSVPKSRGGPP